MKQITSRYWQSKRIVSRLQHLECRERANVLNSTERDELREIRRAKYFHDLQLAEDKRFFARFWHRVYTNHIHRSGTG